MKALFKPAFSILAILLVLLPIPPVSAFNSQQQPTSGNQQQQPAAADQQTPQIPRDELESLVAPIALYPDELLAQVLVASTYPLEIVQLQQWMQKNSNLKDQALIEAVKKQSWDPSIQALVTFPDVVKTLSGNIKWTTDVGNAFLSQQSDVMSAVQVLRAKAKDTGKLESNQQQTVETKVEQGKTVVVIQPADPQVVYVPSYNPTAVWGAATYPYPPVAYPPASYVATGLISFTAGAALGAAWGGHGGWGWNCGWGNNDININNNFVRNNNLNASRTDIRNARGGSTWQHNAQHRGGTPYSNARTAERFGGTTRGAYRQQGNLSGQRAANVRAQRGSNQGGAANLSGQRAGGQTGGRSLARSEFTGSNRADRVGNREISRTPNFDNKGAFGGIRDSGASARASSARGRASMSGGGRSGGGRSGGGRSGGGRRGGGGGRRR